MFKHLLLASFSLLILNSCMENNNLNSSIDSIFKEEYKNNEPGAAVLIMKDDSVVFSKGYGIADMSTMKKIDDNLGELKKQAKDSSDAKDKALQELEGIKAELKKAQDDLMAANEVVDNLKKAPATENVDHPADTNTSEDDEVKVIAESEKMYNQIKDL